MADYEAEYEFLKRRVQAVVEAMRKPRLSKLPYADLLELALLNAERLGERNAPLHFKRPG